MKISADNLPTTTSCFCQANPNPVFEIHRGSHSDPLSFLKVY
jgi:hypothetical protein